MYQVNNEFKIIKLSKKKKEQNQPHNHILFI